MDDLLNLTGIPRAITLLQLTRQISHAISIDPLLQGVWVTAELSDVRVNGGHCYMELLEKNPAGQTVAKLRATIWANRFQYIRQKFYAATGRDIMTGMKVMLYGAASHHPVYGLSFSISDIDPAYTLGDMERLRREILERLQKEGVLGMNKETPLACAPQRIAVISAEGAAGYGDFINQLSSNPYGFVFYPFLFPAVMQGDRTSASVRNALSMIEQTIDLWDCVAIVRGGGATTDLNGFDDYELARAVATFPLPIVVGIGHERDRTVLDEIAHTRVKTPTAVAAFFIDTLRAASDRASELVDWISRYSMERIQGESRRLANCESMIPALVQARIASASSLLEREMTRIPVVVGAKISGASGQLDSIGRIVWAIAGNHILRAGQVVGNMASRVELASGVVLKRAVASLESLEGMVAALSPANTLRRGYSITRVDGKAIKDASQLKRGQRVVTSLLNGEFESEVCEGH